VNRGTTIGAVVLTLAAVVVVVLSLGATGPPPFDAESTSPSGYAAVATILRDRGALVDVRTATSVAQQGFGPGDVIVVPAPELASFADLDAFTDAAANGATLVYGSPPPQRESSIDVDSFDEFLAPIPSTELVDEKLLARTPAVAVPPGECDIVDFAALGQIDGAFAIPFTPSADQPEQRTCFGDAVGVYTSARNVGAGIEITLAGPTMLSNARLWPDKENGGEPLANAALLVRPVEVASSAGPARVTFVRAESSPGSSIGSSGPSNPLRLLPSGIQVALLVTVVAFVFYAWGRSRRLGRVVRERAPVEIAGSELVEAVGDLLRRKGSPDRAAVVLRSEFRRRMGVAAGLGIAPSDDVLLSWLTRHSSVDPAQLHATLSGPIASSDALVALARRIDSITEEVTGVRQSP